MIQHIEGIVLDIVRHNDRHNIVTLYTRSHGRMAFLVPQGKTKAGKMRNAMLTLMSVVKADVNIHPEKELHILRQPETGRTWHKIYANPMKTSLIFFLAEFCMRLVRQYPAEERLWNYIINSLEVLEQLPSGRIANFHIAFLIRLLPIVGIEPSAKQYEENERFDLQTGEMTAKLFDSFHYVTPGRPNAASSLLSENESRHVPQILRISFRNMHIFRLTREERHRVLDIILKYYSIHLSIGSELKSVTVLRELFS